MATAATVKATAEPRPGRRSPASGMLREVDGPGLIARPVGRGEDLLRAVSPARRARSAAPRPPLRSKSTMSHLTWRTSSSCRSALRRPNR